MHPIHHTDSFILKIAPAGETNARVWLFTREFGLVMATVQGVRRARAKLRMQLSEYTRASADLVKGRDTWRLVNVITTAHPLSGNTRGALARSFVRTLHAVLRFCRGEEANEELFLHLTHCVDCLFEDHQPLSFDTVSLSRVMALLGYGSIPEGEEWMMELPLGEASSRISPLSRSRLIKSANESIGYTQL